MQPRPTHHPHRWRARILSTDTGTQALALNGAANPRLLPTEHYEHVQRQQTERGSTGAARVVADYIAGMTDRFAISEYERLFDPAQRS